MVSAARRSDGEWRIVNVGWRAMKGAVSGIEVKAEALTG